MVLAAMYILRLISAALHREIGPSVTDAALDLRPAELGVTVPLVACLLALSAWPAAVSGHSFANNLAVQDVQHQFLGTPQTFFATSGWTGYAPVKSP